MAEAFRCVLLDPTELARAATRAVPELAGLAGIAASRCSVGGGAHAPTLRLQWPGAASLLSTEALLEVALAACPQAAPSRTQGPPRLVRTGRVLALLWPDPGAGTGPDPFAAEMQQTG